MFHYLIFNYNKLYIANYNQFFIKYKIIKSKYKYFNNINLDIPYEIYFTPLSYI